MTSADVMGDLLQGIPNYIKVYLDGLKVNALMDTGSDYSLIRMSELTSSQKAKVVPSNTLAHAVNKEQIQIDGELTMDVRIGNRICVRKHRFIVVSNMVTKVILGMDFWARLGVLTLDLEKMILRINSRGVSLPLLSECEGESDDGITSQVNNSLSVKVEHSVVIPACSEMFVACTVDGQVNNHHYLLCPKRPDDSPVSPPHCFVCTKGEKKLYVRVANVSSTQEVLDCGEVIAELESGAQVTSGRLHMHDTRKGTRIMLGEKLSNMQSTEIKDILKEFDQIFYKGGRLPLVEVGVEHSIRIDPAAAPKASRPRRLSPSLELEVRKELEKLQEMGTIRKSSSPWASPIVCARRANGNIR